MSEQIAIPHEAQYSVNLAITGAPVTSTEHTSTIVFQPSDITIRYVWTNDDDFWDCLDIVISGPRKRKNNTLGVIRYTRTYLGFIAHAPDWIKQYVDDYRPPLELTAPKVRAQ
jgi:hypothetical protein